MDYLTYIQHNAENLQFYLWLHDYRRRFAEKKLRDQALSPEWKPELVLSSGTSGRASSGSLAKQADPILHRVEESKLEEIDPDTPIPRVLSTKISTLLTSGIAGDAASPTSLTRVKELNRITPSLPSM
jgi:hypothetical protein